MHAKIRAALIIALVLSFSRASAFAQETAESILANLNKLPPSERQTKLVEGARRERVVEWYATLPFGQSRPLIDGFRRRYPFLEVKYTRAGGTSLASRAMTEHKTGVDKVDVLGGTSFSHTLLMQADLIARNLAPFRKIVRDGFMDADGYRVAPFTYAMVIGYNTRNVPPDEKPRSYEDLLHPRWKGQMALDREAHEWLAAIIDTMGEEKGLALARQLAAQDLMIQRGHTLMTQLMIAGEVNIVVDGYHYQLDNFKDLGAPVDYIIPDPLLLKNPSATWLAKHAPHPHGAALLIDFLFSREGQEEFARQNRLVARKDMAWDFKERILGRSHVLSSDQWGPKYNDLVTQFDKIFRTGG